MKATFVGANIKGTPAMSAKKVREDLRRIKQTANSFGVQEFSLPWYWRAADTVLGLGDSWGSCPTTVFSRNTPDMRGQAIFFDKKLFKKLRAYRIPAFNFDVDTAHIERNRYVNAALLRAKEDWFTAWNLSTHFVVGGSDHDSSDKRKMLMQQNLNALDKALTHLLKSGYPIIGELDANIHKNGWAYEPFMHMMHKHGAVFHGDLGIEFAFTIDNRHGKFANVQASTIPISQLNTDHESRVLKYTGVPSATTKKKATKK